jgi:hypothetical protein
LQGWPLDDAHLGKLTAVFDLEAEADAETFVSVEECAEAMGVTPGRVRQLVKLRLLRTRWVRGDVLVQPRCLAGHVVTC